jgi:hypothetical protein
MYSTNNTMGNTQSVEKFQDWEMFPTQIEVDLPLGKWEPHFF